jgi:hypothetical protein
MSNMDGESRKKPPSGAGLRPTWSTLGTRARLFRVAHGTFGVFNLAGLVYIWLSAARGRRDRLTYAAIALLSAEGGALVVGGGDCPLGAFQAGLGDPVPMFEWVLPPRAARAAIPALAVLAAVGMLAAMARKRRRD